MAMFPIFILGLLVGALLGGACVDAYLYYKNNMPSEAKLKIEQAKIIRYKSDIEELQKTNDELLKEIEEIKKLKNKK